jgi:transketolase
MGAAKHKLDNLVVMVDYNKNQSYGSTYEVMDLEPFADKWRAFGFAVAECDGHDIAAIAEALSRAGSSAGKPTAIICHTIKGRGIEFAENNLQWHHKSGLKEKEMQQLLQALEGQ